jgi:hypothetical protein
VWTGVSGIIAPELFGGAPGDRTLRAPVRSRTRAPMPRPITAGPGRRLKILPAPRTGSLPHSVTGH